MEGAKADFHVYLASENPWPDHSTASAVARRLIMACIKQIEEDSDGEKLEPGMSPSIFVLLLTSL